MTVAWTGIINTNPAMCYISVRPERYSYNLIKNQGEFVINLTNEKLAYATDWCGVKTGAKVDKFKEMKLTKEAICWYPANGCRQGSTDKLVGTGTYGGWTNKGISGDYTKSYAVLFKSNEINIGKDEVRSNALSVRCQKE